MSDNSEDIKKALVTLYVEKTLLGIGKPVYEKVTKLLYTKYHCYLPDCYEHPEYLDYALKKLFGDSSKVIVKSISRQLEEFNHYDKVKRFLKVICR